VDGAAEQAIEPRHWLGYAEREIERGSFLLAALVLPDIGPETATDLRANYFAHSRWFFGLLVLLLLVSLTKDVVLSGSLPNGLNVGAHVVFIVTSLVAAFVNREWLHRLLAPLNVALMLAYIAVLFARLP